MVKFRTAAGSGAGSGRGTGIGVATAIEKRTASAVEKAIAFANMSRPE